jgi:hypothetical protein
MSSTFASVYALVATAVESRSRPNIQIPSYAQIARRMSTYWKTFYRLSRLLGLANSPKLKHKTVPCNRGPVVNAASPLPQNRRPCATMGGCKCDPLPDSARTTGYDCNLARRFRCPSI